jgi:hypothetical protein
VSDEKKVKLDELPDEGSTPPPQKKTNPKKAPPDPRLSEFRKIDDATKIKVMEQTWSFDVPVWSFDWFPWLLILAAIQLSGYFGQTESLIEGIKTNEEIVGADAILPLLELGSVLLNHPFIFVIFFPLFFNFRKQSEYHFEVKFSGIDTVHEFLPYGSTKNVQRLLVRWDEIHQLKKKIVNGKEIIAIYSKEGHLADLIWYMEIDKKRALKLLLNGMIHPKHPMRDFLEKDC